MDDGTLAPLLGRIARGDEDAMRELFDAARRPLMAFFYRLCRCPELAEDLLQQTFLKVWRYRGQYDGHGGARSYLYRVALNEWRTSHARQQRAMEAREEWVQGIRGEDHRSPSERIEYEEARRHVLMAVESLPEAQRETFLLHRFEGMNCREIAASQGRSQKTVESRLRLALEKLTEKLRVMEGLT